MHLVGAVDDPERPDRLLVRDAVAERLPLGGEARAMLSTRSASPEKRVQ